MVKTKHTAPRRLPPKRPQPHQAAGDASTSTPATRSAAQRSSTRMKRRGALPPEELQNKRRRKRRYKPGSRALLEIRRFQKTQQLLIPAAPFIRLVRSITDQYTREVNRWTAEALIALQEATEDFLVHLFEDGMLCAIHAKRVTLNTKGDDDVDVDKLFLYTFSEKDIELARRLGGKAQPW